MTENERIKEMMGAAQVSIGIWDNCPMARDVYIRDVGCLLISLDKRDEALKVAKQALNYYGDDETFSEHSIGMECGGCPACRDDKGYRATESLAKIDAIMGGEKGAGDGKD